jgi:hypothetical protein
MAEELQKHEGKFLSEMTCGAQARTRLDLPWWKIQIHNMWTGIGDGKLLTGEEIWVELPSASKDGPPTTAAVDEVCGGHGMRGPSSLVSGHLASERG